MSNEDFVDELRRCDFFAGNKESFHNAVKEYSSFLAYGAHRETVPQVSIIILTYKRPQWLKVTLDSALEQEGFDDYEIIIVDNEGEHPDAETETSKFIRSYHDQKIVYYRNFPTVLHYQPDIAISLSRSKWFCLVHDDDFLSKDHLKRMTDVLNKNPGIGYFSCSDQAFDTNDEAIYRERAQENVGASYSLVFFPPQSTCTGSWAGWLGALINRENYINMGGMSLPVITSAGDLIMCMKYMDRYNGVYRALTEKPLYFYRISNAQGSAIGGNVWFNIYVSEYMLYKYLAKRRHPFFSRFWEYIASIIIHDKIRDFARQKSWSGGASFDRAALERLTGLPARNERGIRRWVGKRLLTAIRWYYIRKSPMQIKTPSEFQ